MQRTNYVSVGQHIQNEILLVEIVNEYMEGDLLLYSGSINAIDKEI